MKVKKLLIASAILASTLAGANFANAQDVSNKKNISLQNEEWADYDYDDVKDLPSKVIMPLTDSNEITTLADNATLAFGEGDTYLNRDGLSWYGTHATTVTNGKLIMYFSVFGDLLKKPKGSSSLKMIDNDVDTKYATNNGVVIAETEGATGVVGDTIIAKSHHEVNLGWSTSTADTKAEQEL